MSASIFYEYYHDQKRILSRCICDILNGKTDDRTVNLLRTSIKRLRALCGTAETLILCPTKQALPDLKKIFKAAAALRDFQVVLKVIARKKKKIILEALKSEILENIKTAETDLLSVLNDFNFKATDTVFEHLNREFIQQKIKTDQIETVARIKASELALSLTRCNTENHFHKARIRLKEVVYIEELLQKNTENGNNLIKFGAKMGRWHDRVVFCEKLFAFKFKHPVDEETESFYKMQFRDNRRKMEKMVYELDEILQNFLHE